RGRLARQIFSKLCIEKIEKEREINRVREEFSKFKMEKAEQDDEFARMREENAKLKKQLAELLRTSQELGALMRLRRDQQGGRTHAEDDPAAGDDARQVLEDRQLASTEPDKLNSSDSSSAFIENEHWKKVCH
ncbi:hypothetical protein PHYSODRAFT_256960, partial [Phytophthora sojae]